MLNKNSLTEQQKRMIIDLSNRLCSEPVNSPPYVEEPEITQYRVKKEQSGYCGGLLTISECKYLYEYVKKDYYYRIHDLKNAIDLVYAHDDTNKLHLSGKGKKLYAMLEKNEGDFYSGIETKIDLNELCEQYKTKQIDVIDIYKLHFVHKVLSRENFDDLFNLLQIYTVKKLSSREIEKYISDALNSPGFCIVKRSYNGCYSVDAIDGFETASYINVAELKENYKNNRITIRSVVLLNWHKLLSSVDLFEVIQMKTEPKIYVSNHGSEDKFYTAIADPDSEMHCSIISCY